VQLQSIAHGVITLVQLAPVYGAERRRLRVIKLRGAKYRGGFHDFSIVRGGLCVYPRLVAAEHEMAGERTPVPSGVAELDQLLGGGPDRGTSTLLMGPAGSGKSTVGVQYAVAAALRGERAVIFAFDESSATLLTRARGLGLPIDQVVRDGTLIIRQIDPAEMSPGEFAVLVQDTVERDGARLVMIDSLNGYLNAMPEERFLTVQLHELLTVLGGRGVTTILVVAQRGMIGANMQTAVDTSYLADSVVIFRYFEYRGELRKALSVMKKRSGRHEFTIRELLLDESGVHVSEPLVNFQGLLTGLPVEVTGGSSSA
jgi:circadian clock protein KaiC